MSEGLPLVVEDLLSVAVSGELPRRFADSVRDRLKGLAEVSSRAVQAAALLGERVDWRVVVDATALDETAASVGLHDAIAADLVAADGADVVFRHALTRAVVVAQVLPLERIQLCDALASSCLALHRPSLARDLLVAELWTTAKVPWRAVDVLLAAVARAESAGELSDAEVACTRAYLLALDDSGSSTVQAFAIGVDLVRLRLRIGRPVQAAELGETLLGRSVGRDQTTTLVLHTLLARAAVARGLWSSAESHLAAARAYRLPDDVIADIAVLEAECAFGADRPGQRAAVEFQVATAIELAKGGGIARIECDAYDLAGRVARQHDLHAAAALLGRALSVAESAHLRVERLRVLNEQGTVEMLRDADTAGLERAYREALREGAFGAAASAGLNLASGYAMTGRHHDSAELAAEVEKRAARLGLSPLEAACQLIRGIAASFLHDTVAAEVHLVNAERLAPNDSDLRAGAWAIGRGIGALIDDDRPRARRAFATAKSLAPERHARILDPALGPNMVLDALDHQVSPDDVASAVLTEVRGARWSQLWLNTAAAITLAHNGNLVAAELALTTALNAGDRYPLFSALCRRLAAESAIATRFVDPVALLRDAESGFTDLHLTRTAESVRGQLRSLGVPAPRQRGTAPVDSHLTRAGVTAREAEVLSLLADRRTNREIAAELFLSPKTVEKHVAALAMKLNAPDRKVLAEIARTRRRS